MSYKHLGAGAASLAMSFAFHAGIVAQAHADTPVNSGVGWKAETVTFPTTTYRINSLRHNQTYTIEFGDTASRTQLTPYANIVVNQLNALPAVSSAGITFKISTTLAPITEKTGATGPGVCPTIYHINLTLRQSATKGMSWTYPCVTGDRFAWGADVWIDPEYWSGDWFGSDPTVNDVKTKNAVSHEIGHAIGLDHPDTFTLPTGAVAPLMMPSNGVGTMPTNGYQNDTDAGKFTPYDTTGINQMVANGGM